jgi:hypothetical protein
MLAVAATIAALLALIIGVLAVPLVVVVDAQRVERLNVQWRVRWLFGLVNVRSTKRLPASPAPTGANRKRRAQPSAKDRGRGSYVGLAVLTTRGFVRRAVQLAATLLQRVKIEHFHVDAAVGLEDPADTGILYGCLSPLLLVADARGLDVRYRPIFAERGVRGDCGVTLHVRPLSIVGTMVAFLLSPPVVRAMRAAWRARR